MNARRKAARDQILRAAADLFRERGYPASTVDLIAARLGMSKASLYTHFRAKEEMLAAISRETIEAFTRDLNLVLASRLGAEDKLRTVVRQHVQFVIANRSFLTVFFGELGMVNWVHKWYNPRGGWEAEEISAAFLALIEGGLLRRQPRGRALSSRLRRLERELHDVARALDA
jgi:AcrR family transcriptional regulator